MGTDINRRAAALVRSLSTLRAATTPTMEAQTVIALCMVAAGEGPVDQGDIQRQLGLVSSSASRTSALLSKIGVDGRPGLDLVHVEINPLDRRLRSLTLNARGRALMQRVLKPLEAA